MNDGQTSRARQKPPTNFSALDVDCVSWTVARRARPAPRASAKPANTEVATEVVRKSFGSRFAAADFEHIDMDCLGVKRGLADKGAVGRSPKVERRRSEGGAATVGRWTNGGRKVEATDQFPAPRWRSIRHEKFHLGLPESPDHRRQFAVAAPVPKVTSDGRRVDPTERFQPPRWGLISCGNSRSSCSARAGEGSTLTPPYEAAGEVAT